MRINTIMTFNGWWQIIQSILGNQKRTAKPEYRAPFKIYGE